MLPDQLRYFLRQLPHLLTLSRLASTPFLAWCILHRRFWEALAIVGVAGITDGLDGYAARKLGVSGRVGLILDPISDKCMLVTLFCALAWAGLIPAWIFVLVMARDLVIVIGSVLLRWLRNVRRFLPSVLGKVSTFFQIVYVLLALLYPAAPHAVLYWLRETALVLTSGFTFASGAGYVRLGVQLASRKPKSAVA